MKTKIYVVVVVVLVLCSILLVGMYYSQDFTEEITFEKTVAFGDIKFEERTDWDNKTYLSRAQIDIGKIKLKNNGYFPQKYTFPTFVGCVSLKEGDTKYIKFNVYPKSDTEKYNLYYYPAENDLEIPIGGEVEKTVIGTYNDYGDVLMSSITKKNITWIKVYEIPKKEFNPLGEVYYDGQSPSGTCERLDVEKTAVAVIGII